jgi:predicted ester cyclase
MKRLFCVIPVVCLLCFAFACQNKAAMAELEQFKAQAAVEKANLALVVRSQEAWGSADIKTLREIFSPNLVYHLMGQEMSLEEMFAEIKQSKAMFPDGKYIWDENFVKGNQVATRVSFRGTHSGDIEGFPATGNIVELTNMLSICRIEDGKIVEFWVAEDTLNFYQQLGMELKPKEGRK